MTISAVWTIEVGGESRKYKNAKFERKLKKDTPTSFSAQIEYASPAVAYFDLVEIKRNGTTEWKGYVESISIEWSNAGRYYNVSGRDTSLILWKKYNEEFQSYAEGIKGFFGKVKASELIQFLLRTPRSDLPYESDDYKYNKQGWGIDGNRIIDITAARTSYGDTKWTTLRKRSVAGWRNVGSPYTLATKTITSIISNTWSDHYGASPYVDSDDDATSYIESATVNQTAIFQLDDLAGATGINSVHLSVKWRPDNTGAFWVSSLCEVYVSNDAGVTWFSVGSFGGRNALAGSEPWFLFNYDVSNIFSTVSSLSGGNAQIKFINKSNWLSTSITYACLSINHSSSGLQDVSDFLQLTFNEEDIMGIYVESRADEESYPRNYEIVYLTDTLETFTDFSETDPETHIALTDSDTTVLFDSFQDEDAYLYKDYGLNQINAFDWKFSFEITTPQDHAKCYCPFVVSQALDDLHGLEDGADYFSALYVKCASAVLNVYIENLDGNGTTTTSAHLITAGTEYFIRVVRSGTMLRYMCYSDSSLKSDYLLWTETITLSVSTIKYRYRMQACTYNGLEDKTDAIDASYAVDGWTNVHEGWTKVGDSPCLGTDDDATSYINCAIATANLGYYDEYYSFTNLDVKYTSIDLTKVEIHLKGRHNGHTGGDVNVRVYIYDGGWVDCGTVTFTDSWADKSINIIATLDTLAKLNGARLKVSLDAFGGNEDGSVQISYACLHIEGTAHYTTATHTSGEIHTYYPTEVTLVSAVTGNTYRDIIHSWSPVNIGNIRIKITNSDSHAWAVTQIYIYKAESTDYRIMHEDASTPSFALNQYIHVITVDDVYATAIGPLNISEGRVIDQINSIFDNLHTAYVPYEWYMEMVTNNTFHICDAKGSDKSATVTFVLGTNLKGVEREQTVENTFQRVKVRGNGEGARSDLASSGWVNDTTAMTTAKTFMEEIDSQKEIASKDIADLLAEILLKENATPKDAIQCDVSKDTYVSMAYDVGDSVKITDSLISVDAAKKIFNIMKSFDEGGEQVTLYLGAPYEDKETMLKEIFNRIKNLELSGGITGDWTDQAKPSMVSATKINTLFEKTAKEENLVAGDDAGDVKWEKSPTLGTQGTAFVCDDNGIAMQGATSGAQIITTVDYKWNTSSVETDDVEYILVPRQNPKIEFEFKAYDQVTGGVLSWKSGDFFDVGLAKDTATYITGAWFRFLSIGSGNIEVYSVSRDIGETSETAKYIATISTNTRYRFIIKYDYDRRWITWEMWDIVNKAVYPLVAVKTGISVSDTQSVHPLFMQLTSNYAAGYRAQAILYHTKIEFESVTYELGSDE